MLTRDTEWRFEPHGDSLTLWQKHPKERVLSIRDGVIPMNEQKRLIEALPRLAWELGCIATALTDGDTVTIEPGSVKAATVIDAALQAGLIQVED